MTDSRTSWMTMLMVGILCLASAPAHSDDEDVEEPEFDEIELEPAEAERAKELTAALVAARKKKKNSANIMAALDEIEGLASPDFEKPLLKLMLYADGDVAVRATEFLELRRNEKLLKKIWKNGIKHKANKKRYAVRARVYRAFGKTGEPLDKNQYKELSSDWRWMVGNPNEKWGPPLVVICEYFQYSKDKRHCRKLAEELDEPTATNPNSPSNPPAEWWERKWKMWNPMKPAVVAALAAMTGQEFDKTEEAKAWFQENQKQFGFKW